MAVIFVDIWPEKHKFGKLLGTNCPETCQKYIHITSSSKKYYKPSGQMSLNFERRGTFGKRDLLLSTDFGRTWVILFHSLSVRVWMSRIWPIWSISFPPEKSGLPVSISARMQPTLQMSRALV